MRIIEWLKEHLFVCCHVWKIDKIVGGKHQIIVYKHCIKCGRTKVVHQ